MVELTTTVGVDGAPDLQAGLYLVESHAPILIGGQCRACGRVHFPKPSYCARCGGGDVENLKLSRVGKIGAFSYIDRQPAEAFIVAPYLQAEIEMPEGVSVFTVIEAPPAGSLAIGMEAEVALKVYPTPAGPRRSYVFKPLTDQGRRL